MRGTALDPPGPVLTVSPFSDTTGNTRNEGERADTVLLHQTWTKPGGLVSSN